MPLTELVEKPLQFIMFGGKGGVGKTSMSAATALGFAKEYAEDILDILQEGTYFANEEAEELFSLDIPGLDEVMGLKKITDFMDSQEYSLYIVDTAPTGHTLRLLTLPELLDDWIKFLASLRWKYHAMVRQFAREERVT